MCQISDIFCVVEGRRGRRSFISTFPTFGLSGEDTYRNELQVKKHDFSLYYPSKYRGDGSLQESIEAS